MIRNEFKEKYFTNNFYWVNAENYKKLQTIGLEFGCLNPNKQSSIIKMHKGFNNLGFRTRENEPTKFQKEAFLLHNEKATCYQDMLDDYVLLTNNYEKP